MPYYWQGLLHTGGDSCAWKAVSIAEGSCPTFRLVAEWTSGLAPSARSYRSRSVIGEWPGKNDPNYARKSSRGRDPEPVPYGKRMDDQSWRTTALNLVLRLHMVKSRGFSLARPTPVYEPIRHSTPVADLPTLTLHSLIRMALPATGRESSRGRFRVQGRCQSESDLDPWKPLAVLAGTHAVNGQDRPPRHEHRLNHGLPGQPRVATLG